MIFDTDILIWSGKGHKDAAAQIGQSTHRCISVQTAMEFLQGSTHKLVLKERRAFLQDLRFEVLALTPNIGHRALIYIESWALSHGLRSGDALIAATAVENEMALCTANGKHFSFIKDLELNVLKA